MATLIVTKQGLQRKGYMQKYGVNYEEMFVPVVLLDIVILIISLVVTRKWKIYQLDVKSVFLNGILKEEVCVG